MKLFLRRTCVLNLVMQLFLCFVGVRERAEVFTQRRKGNVHKGKGGASFFASLVLRFLCVQIFRFIFHAKEQRKCTQRAQRKVDIENLIV